MFSKTCPKSNILEIWHFSTRELALLATRFGISLEMNRQMPFIGMAILGVPNACFVCLCSSMNYLYISLFCAFLTKNAELAIILELIVYSDCLKIG